MKKLIFAFWAAAMGFDASAQVIQIEEQTRQVRQSEEFIAFQKYQKAHEDPTGQQKIPSGLDCEQYVHRWTLRWNSPRDFQVWDKSANSNPCHWLQNPDKQQVEWGGEGYGYLIRPIGDRYILVRLMLIASRFENTDYIYERR